MAKPLGLARPKGRNPQVRIIIPVDLREDFGGRRDFRISLGTLTGADAQAEAHRLRATHEADFQARRKARNAPQPVPVEITPDLADSIAEAVYAAEMAQDDELRESVQGITALSELAALVPVPGVGLRLDEGKMGNFPTEQAPRAAQTRQAVHGEGLSDASAQVLADLNALIEAGAAVDLARRRTAVVLPQVQAVTKAAGAAIDWNSEGGRHALRKSLEARRRAKADRARRDLGEMIPTPAPPALSVSAAPGMATPTPQKIRTLRDVLEPWKNIKRPVKSTEAKVAYAVSLWEKCFGPVALESLTKAQGAEFTAFLLQECKAEKTAKDHLNSVKALLNFAADVLDVLPVNPWRAHQITVKKRRQRKPWTPEALRVLVSTSLFQAYDLPVTTNAGGAAAYWVPLLGLYTGARQSELCQLRLEDVGEDAEGLTLFIMSDVGDEEEGVPETTTKTDASQRRVPVHSDLIRLGFGDYVKDRRAAGSVHLFPEVRRAPGRPAGEYFSDWFKLYRDALGLTQRYMDFHAFRHTARTRLTDAGVEGNLSDSLLGHTDGASTGRRTYDHSIATLRPALEKLAYPELQKLPRVYPVRSARPRAAAQGGAAR